MDVLNLLERRDKWFLGGGKGSIYAPPFPRFLQAPGFWDDCHFADVRLSRLYTVLFLDDDGRPVRLTTTLESWRPDRLVLLHTAGNVKIRERRCVLESQAWVSELELIEGTQPLNAFLWTLPEVREAGAGTPWQSLTDAEVTPDSIRLTLDTAWPSELEPDRTAVEAEAIQTAVEMGELLSLFLELGANAPRESFTVNFAQRHDDAPLWETSLLPEKFRNGALANQFRLFVGAPPIEGLLHALQHYRLTPGKPLVVAAGAGLSKAAARAALEDALAPEPLIRSEEAWRRYFASVPQFESSDPYLNAAYWYRWYGLRLNTVGIEGLPIHRGGTFSPFVTEGIGFFRNFVTYSAQAHLREATWMHSPDLAEGILENLAKCQHEDGSFPGHNYSCRPARDFYHADFATGAAQFEALHGKPVPASTTDALKRYAGYFLKHRADPDTPGLYCVFDQNETGQEYMSRYQFVSERADEWTTFSVAGMDATTYAANLFSYVGLEDEANRAVDAVFGEAWDVEASFFADVAKGRRSPARPATGFYPWLLAANPQFAPKFGADERRQLERWLLDPAEFWGKRGFPATAKSDPTYAPEGEWRDKRLNCPWSGRSWPMVNSHLVDAIAAAARALDDAELKTKAADALRKTIELLFHDGDPSRPCCFEHYNPETGMPALYRGYDDYMHSWVVDLIMRHAVGVQPRKDDVDPLPLGIDLVCTDIPHPKGRMDVRITNGVASVTLRPAQ